MIQINNPIVIANSQAAFTRVQPASTAHAISASSPITISKAFVSGNAAGNMIIVVLGIWNNANLSAPPTATMSDSAGNSYTLIKLLTLSRTVTSNGACYAWVAFNIAGGANTVSTVATFGNGAATQIDGELMILEYQPPLAGAAQDQLNFATSIVSR